MDSLGFLLLGVDSLIACIAVGAVVGTKARVPFALCFGIGDAGGFLLGTLFHWNMPDDVATVVETAVLVALGAYWIVLALVTKRFTGTRWVWALPWLLAIDNITFGVVDDSWGTSVWAQAAEQFVSSAILAGIGILISVAAVRAIPALRRSFGEAGHGPALMAGGGGGAVMTRTTTGTLAGVVGGVALIVAAAVLLALG